MLSVIFSIILYFSYVLQTFHTQLYSTITNPHILSRDENKTFDLSAGTYYGDTSDSEAASTYSVPPKWEISPDGIVRIPYAMFDNVTDNMRLIIYYGMEIIQRGTNILYIPKTDNDVRYIQFSKHPQLCDAIVGMYYSWGEHRINFADSCFGVTAVLHELFHSLGILHEHQRDDRHTIIKISNPANDAIIRRLNQNIKYLTPYDLWSISHYDFSNVEDMSASFTRIINPKYKLGPLQMGVPTTLSSCDWQAISELYNNNKPAPFCVPSTKPVSYIYPAPSFLRTSADTKFAYRFCSGYMGIPGMLQCSLNNNEEFPDTPWLDEVKYLSSSVVSYAKRREFCNSVDSRNNKRISSKKCQQYCIKDCPFTHRNQTLRECINQHPDCYIR